MKKEIKLTKKSFLGYILILVGLALLISPLILRSYNDIRSNASKKVFEKQEAAKSADLIEEENKKAQAYNEIIKNSDMSVQDPFTTDEYENGYDMFTKTNTPFAYLSIPKLDKYLPLYIDATKEHISRGGSPSCRHSYAGRWSWNKVCHSRP